MSGIAAPTNYGAPEYAPFKRAQFITDHLTVKKILRPNGKRPKIRCHAAARVLQAEHALDASEREIQIARTVHPDHNRNCPDNGCICLCVEPASPWPAE